MLYGLSWPIAFTTLFLFEGALSKAGAFDEVLGPVAPAGPAMLVGVINLVGAAVWRSVVMFALGAWLCLVVAVGSYFGVSRFAGTMALAGGGGFVLAGAALALPTRS